MIICGNTVTEINKGSIVVDPMFEIKFNSGKHILYKSVIDALNGTMRTYMRIFERLGKTTFSFVQFNTALTTYEDVVAMDFPHDTNVPYIINKVSNINFSDFDVTYSY